VQSWTSVGSIWCRVGHRSGPSGAELDIGRVHPWVGSQNSPSSMGGSGRVQCQKYLINIQFTHKKPIVRRLYFVMISCNIAIYYRLIIFIPTLRTCHSGKKAVVRETLMLASELKSHFLDTLKDSAADDKLISRAQVGRTGSGPDIHVNCGSGRVGLGQEN